MILKTCCLEEFCRFSHHFVCASNLAWRLVDSIVSKSLYLEILYCNIYSRRSWRMGVYWFVNVCRFSLLNFITSILVYRLLSQSRFRIHLLKISWRLKSPTSLHAFYSLLWTLQTARSLYHHLSSSAIMLFAFLRIFPAIAVYSII